MPKVTLSVSLGSLLESFFNKRLVEQQNVSQNTVNSYRDTWRLFIRFLTLEQDLPLAKLSVDMVTADSVLQFLSFLEIDRKCGVRTRNQRRAAIRAFAQHAILYEPQYMEQFQRILAIPSKRYKKAALCYLTRDEMNAILSAPDTSAENGQRDHALLTLMYNTGARVSEIASVCRCDVNGAKVILHGKGGKDRVMPLWPETVKVLSDFASVGNIDSNQHLFHNDRGDPITRSGIAYILRMTVASAARSCPSLVEKRISPHIIRHTTAMHLLQSGVDINTIRLWLGHVNLNTTHCYIEADLDMKRKALENGGISKPESYSWKPTDEVKAFLDTLGVH